MPNQRTPDEEIERLTQILARDREATVQFATVMRAAIRDLDSLQRQHQKLVESMGAALRKLEVYEQWQPPTVGPSDDRPHIGTHI